MIGKSNHSGWALLYGSEGALTYSCMAAVNLNWTIYYFLCCWVSLIYSKAGSVEILSVWSIQWTFVLDLFLTVSHDPPLSLCAAGSCLLASHWYNSEIRSLGLSVDAVRKKNPSLFFKSRFDSTLSRSVFLCPDNFFKDMRVFYTNSSTWTCCLHDKFT